MQNFVQSPVINQKLGICYNEFVKYCFVELPKLRRVVTERDQWDEGMPEEIRSSEIKQAYQEISVLGWRKKEREDYKNSLLARFDIKNAMHRERRKGKEEGRKEEKRETARKLLLKMSVKDVAEITELSVEEVEALKE